MAKTISNKISVKASSAKPLGKPPTGVKNLGIDPAICFYAVEDGDETEEGEEAYIIFVYDSSLATSKQNLVKRKFPYIYIFYYDEPVVISTMRDITARVFDHLEITSHMDVDKRLAYTQRIIRGFTLTKYREVLVTCRHSAKNIAGDMWTLVKLTGLSS